MFPDTAKLGAGRRRSFFEFISTAPDRMIVLAGDCSGDEGIRRLERIAPDIRMVFESYPRLAEALRHFNKVVYEASALEAFLTMAAHSLDLASHRLTVANAGHSPTVIRRSSGSIDYSFAEMVAGFPLGLMEDYEYQSAEIELSLGDVIFSYGDWVGDLANAQSKIYGFERLLSALSSLEGSPSEMGLSLIRHFESFTGRGVDTDLTSLLLIQRIA
jgi:serine phosphatase RsbU (regulator of sigma subunit)